MGYDGWIEYDGAELVNLSRTAQLAATLGISAVWTQPASVAWIQDALGGVDYDDITEAPWYDDGHPASAEFAGFVPLSISGLDDSTLEASVVEYIHDGGNAGAPRSTTLPIVAGLAVVASTDRGADFGKRWLDRRLRKSGTKMFCSGSDLRYFQFVPPEKDAALAVQAHRRDVSLTRGTSVTRKRSGDGSVVWFVTFTWTANDPYEYGEEIAQFTALGGAVTGPGVGTSGSEAMTEVPCPAYDYTPVYDPLYPALVAPPTAPDFYPDGWGIAAGQAFTRYWTRLNPVEPSGLNVVPMLTLTTSTEARRVRVAVWPSQHVVTDQCDPLFAVVVTYLPAGTNFIIDGEQQAAYIWDGVSPVVRRADSVTYGMDATPVVWSSFNDPDGLLVTLDIFTGEGGGNVRAALALVPKSG